MEMKKRAGFLGGMLNAILQMLIAQAFGISPLEAGSILEAPDTVERRAAGEVHHGR
jgi:hypothetical protein